MKNKKNLNIIKEVNLYIKKKKKMKIKMKNKMSQNIIQYINI